MEGVQGRQGRGRAPGRSPGPAGGAGFTASAAKAASQRCRRWPRVSSRSGWDTARPRRTPRATNGESSEYRLASNHIEQEDVPVVAFTDPAQDLLVGGKRRANVAYG